MGEWAKLKVVDLKAELKRRDLPQHGLKAELVARLTEADATAEAEAEAESAADQQDEQVEATENELAGDANEQSNDAPQVGITQDQDAVPAEPVVVKTPELDDAGADENAPAENPTGDDNNAPDTAMEEAAINQPTQELPEEAPVDTIAAEPSNTSVQPEETKPKKETSIEADQDRMDTSADQQASSSELDSQKRKRRSVTPPPDEEAVAKRARLNESELDNAVPVVQSAKEEAGVDQGKPAGAEKDQPTPESEPREEKTADEVDHERSVAPAVHPATSALYISNLMRPVRPIDIQTHLIDLATPPGQSLKNEVIVNFYLDPVRTHALVLFSSTAAASRVRTRLHDCVWPNESNRKALWVDFIPPHKVQDWIDMESGDGGRSSTRWEVVYSNDSDGNVEARLETVSAAGPRPGPPPSSTTTGGRIDPSLPIEGLNIPSGPRSQRELGNPPTGPRSKRSGPGPRPPAAPFAAGSSQSKRTTANPPISYTPVPEDLARRRADNMRSFYKPDVGRRELSRDFNRYSFENGDSFVDRGKEVFEGIRPPHRERNMRGGRPGGGGGGGGFGGRRGGRWRGGGDRYLPGGGGGRNDRPPRRDDRR